MFTFDLDFKINIMKHSTFYILHSTLFRGIVFLFLAMMASSANAQNFQLTLTPSNYNNYNISCFGFRDGSIDLTVTGGTSPYSYRWSTEDTIQDLTNLAAGYYQVIVTDKNNNTAEIAITLKEPEMLINDFVVSTYPNGYNISCYDCFNGSIYNFSGGGVPPYTYVWEDGPTTKDRIAMGRGTYALVITDANGCTYAPEQFYLFEPDRSDWTMNGNTGSNPGSNFIGTSDNKDLVFKTNNLERMRLFASGHLKVNALAGTGTHALVIDNDGIISKAPCFTWDQCGNTISVSNFIGSKNAIDVKFKVNSDLNSSSVMTLKVNGNIGIGTDAPTSKFEVQHSTPMGQSNGINIVNTNFGNFNNEIKFSAYFSSNPLWAIGNDVHHNGGQNFFIYDNIVNAPYGHTRLLIDEHGRLGIDTETPSQKLEVVHNDNGGGIAINRVNTNNVSKSEIKFLHNGVPQFAFGTDLNNTGGHDLFIWDHAASGGTGATRFLIDADGDIGIGTEDPEERIHLKQGNIFINSENTGLIVDEGDNKRVGFLKYSGKEGGIWRVEGQKFEIGRAMGVSHLPGTPTSLQTDLIIDGNGKVGLGVVPPIGSLYRLFVEDGIATRDIMVQATGWPDFVFDDQYPLLSIRDLEQFIFTNNHLPNVPSEKDILENGGYEVGEMQTILLQKIEEQSLYIINLQNQIDALKILLENR